MPGVQGGSPPRLRFVDGLRGLAALYILLHHAALLVPPGELSDLGVAARFVLRHGHSSVAVFIVLSGFCLMLPVARDGRRRLPDGLWMYLGRRARRILPPYYATLALCGILIVLAPGLGRPSRSMWDRSLPASGDGIIAAHVFLVHNLSPRWIDKIEPPLWSIATEWQIYLVFPALLGLRRRAGMGTVVAAGFALGFAVAAGSVWLGNPALRQLCPWYLGLFALGMAAAEASLGAETSGTALWSGSTRLIVVLATLLVAATTLTTLGPHRDLIADSVVGALTAVVLVRWSRISIAAAVPARPPGLRLLESRGPVALGSFSYSLYLTHFPLLALADSTLRQWGSTADRRLTVLTLGVAPLCLLFAYLFYRVFERPRLPGRLAVAAPRAKTPRGPTARAEDARALEPLWG